MCGGGQTSFSLTVVYMDDGRFLVCVWGGTNKLQSDCGIYG